ncbi:MAG: N-acetylglucosamine-6-phosphate deacetylase [Pirellulaceae bacterium]|nr:N-acetylglucosamine-6-phosphate deacetylase [Pirellulaceae bacterium]
MKRYVDLQVNGFMGVDFNDPKLDQASIIKAAKSMRDDGVESALATVITGPLEAMCACLANVARAIEADRQVAEVIGGLHVEGPFISRVKGYVGAHPADCVLGDDVAALDKLLQAGAGHVKLVTLAPEVDPQDKLVRHLVDRGILVAAGHTDASVDDLQRSIDAGLTLFTHIGNACPQHVHRHDNILQRAMSLAGQLKITFIADGWHLPSFVVKNLLRCATLEHLAVVSDAIAAAGLGPGEFQLGDRMVKVGSDKCARSPDGEHFVGAAATMADADHWLTNVVGLSAADRQTLLYDNPKKWLASVASTTA